MVQGLDNNACECAEDRTATFRNPSPWPHKSARPFTRLLVRTGWYATSDRKTRGTDRATECVCHNCNAKTQFVVVPSNGLASASLHHNDCILGAVIRGSPFSDDTGLLLKKWTDAKQEGNTNAECDLLLTQVLLPRARTFSLLASSLDLADWRSDLETHARLALEGLYYMPQTITEPFSAACADCTFVLNDYSTGMDELSRHEKRRPACQFLTHFQQFIKTNHEELLHKLVEALQETPEVCQSEADKCEAGDSQTVEEEADKERASETEVSEKEVSEKEASEKDKAEKEIDEGGFDANDTAEPIIVEDSFIVSDTENVPETNNNDQKEDKIPSKRMFSALDEASDQKKPKPISVTAITNSEQTAQNSGLPIVYNENSNAAEEEEEEEDDDDNGTQPVPMDIIYTQPASYLALTQYPTGGIGSDVPVDNDSDCVEKNVEVDDDNITYKDEDDKESEVLEISQRKLGKRRRSSSLQLKKKRRISNEQLIVTASASEDADVDDHDSLHEDDNDSICSMVEYTQFTVADNDMEMDATQASVNATQTSKMHVKISDELSGTMKKIKQRSLQFSKQELECNFGDLLKQMVDDILESFVNERENAWNKIIGSQVDTYIQEL